MKSFLTAVGVLGLIPAALAATGWPQFRGPAGDGHATVRGLPLTWSSSENVKWKVAVPGLGWSSPALRDGRIYLTTALGTDALSLHALCLDAATGKTVWDTEVFAANAPKVHKKNSQASPTPIIDGDRVYVHFGHLGTACLDLEGTVRWRNADLGYSPVHGNGGSPMVVEDLLIFSCDGASNPFVVALDKLTGKVRWRVARESAASKRFSFSTPSLITVNGQSQLITPGSGVVCALDPKTGRELWRCRYTEGYSVIPRPVFGHGLVFIATGYDKPTVIAIRADGRGDVTDTHVAWTLPKGAPHTPSLLLLGDELYMVSDAGIATCVEARTGKVHWSERAGGNFSASPLFADGRIYLQNETGTGVVLKPGRRFEKLAENSVGERTLASYAAIDGALFIRGEQHLFRIEGKP